MSNAPKAKYYKCQHENFDAAVAVTRIVDKGRFLAEIKIKCRDCGVPMQFMGLNEGLNYNQASVSLDGLEARIGIYPQGVRPNPLQTMMGYSVSTHN